MQTKISVVKMLFSSAIELNFDLKRRVDFNLKIWFCYTLESPDCTLLKELILLLTLTTIVGQSLDDAKMECLTSKHMLDFSHLKEA